MSNTYAVPTVVGTYHVSKAAVDTLVPAFVAQWDQWVAGETAKRPQHRARSYTAFTTLDFPDAGQILATILVFPFMVYGKSTSAEPLSVVSFVKQYAQDWFNVTSYPAKEAAGVFDVVYGLLRFAADATGMLDFKVQPVLGSQFDLYVPVVTPAGAALYEALGIEIDAHSFTSTSAQPATAPISYDAVPWVDGLSQSFVDAQSEEVNASFIAAATAASSVPFVIDPYLAEAYLAWKALA